MVGVKVYVEGGGNAKSLHSECRKGFSCFLQKAGFKGHMPRLVACGSRQTAFDKFNTALSCGEIALLLVDSEAAIEFGTSPWMHLRNRPGDGFQMPDSAKDEDCHFMVVCMESWFLADKETLSSFFGQGFNASALPQNPIIENVSKHDVYTGLKKATAQCKTKTPYGKGTHSFKILGRISPEKVSAASPWAKRFLDTLNNVMNG